MLLNDLKKCKEANINILDKTQYLFPLITKGLITFESIIFINHVYNILYSLPINNNEIELFLENKVIFTCNKYSSFLTPLNKEIVINNINYVYGTIK